MKSYVSPKKKEKKILYYILHDRCDRQPKKKKKRVGSKILEQETSTIGDKKD